MTDRKRSEEQRRVALIERELAELGEECARVLLLLQELAKRRAAGKRVSVVLTDLGTSIVHLHAHTGGLDELVDSLA